MAAFVLQKTEFVLHDILISHVFNIPDSANSLFINRFYLNEIFSFQKVVFHGS